MALYQHRFGGHTSVGSNWMFGWWSDSGSGIDTVHAAGISWIETFWNGNYAGVVSAGVGVDQVLTSLVDQGSGTQQEIREEGSTLAGTAVADSMPADVAIVVSLRTALANRRGRGRFYLPQPSTTALDPSGRVNAATQDDIITWLTSAWSGYGVGTPVVYSRASRSTQVITSFNVGDLFDTQRNRERRVLEARDSAPMP